MKKISAILLSGALLLGMFSCTNEPIVEAPDTNDVETRAQFASTLDLFPALASFTHEGGTMSVGIVNDSPLGQRITYRVVSYPDWITGVDILPGGPVYQLMQETTSTPDYIERYFEITALANLGSMERSGHVVIERNGVLSVIPVFQS